jgi:hypothetical protein
MDDAKTADADADPDAIELAIDNALETTVLKMTPTMLADWCQDVARGIYPPKVIARRYGFASDQAMFSVMKTNEALRQRIKAERIAWNSDTNLQTRLRIQYGLILSETAHENGRALFDPGTPVSARNDLMKTCAIIAGVHGTPAQIRAGESAAAFGNAAAPFNVQIVFASTGQTETFATSVTAPVIAADTPVIDAEAEDDA